MKFLIMNAAALGVVCLPALAHAAEQSKMLGDIRADYVVAPTPAGGAASDLAGAGQGIDPRDLLGPAKSVNIEAPAPITPPAK